MNFVVIFVEPPIKQVATFLPDPNKLLCHQIQLIHQNIVPPSSFQHLSSKQRHCRVKLRLSMVKNFFKLTFLDRSQLGLSFSISTGSFIVTFISLTSSLDCSGLSSSTLFDIKSRRKFSNNGLNLTTILSAISSTSIQLSSQLLLYISMSEGFCFITLNITICIYQR